MRARSHGQDDHRQQLCRDIINGTIQDILSRQDDWAFLYRTAEILSVTSQTDYALPTDFGYLQNGGIDDVKFTVYRPSESYRFLDTTATYSTNKPVCTIRQLTTAPFANLGTVFPTFNSKEITGLGTAFDTRVVGRFFKSERDGELYQVASYSDANTLQLSNDYRGRSQAGRVQVSSDDPTIVIGNPNVTNFTPDMTGRYMYIEGSGTSYFQISSVDAINQRITLTASATAGSDLIFSIEDSYEIDPAGQFIMQIAPAPLENDLVIAVNYVAVHVDLTEDGQIPVIPKQFHQVIVFGATAEMMRVTNWPDSRTIEMYEGRYEAGVARLQNNDDPLGASVSTSALPDTMRPALRRTSIAQS